MKKNIKSKIVVPALGLILLSTAASISGSVAWFTANRTATINAGSFAVVKTSENLTCDLTNGVGTTSVDPDGSTAGSITTTDGYKLTDSSFNHIKNNADPVLPVIEPNLARDKVAKVSALSALNDSALVRDNANHVYSAFTWDMAFTISFSETAVADQGLYIDLSTSYMHEKVHFNVGDNVEANTYYSNPDCTGDYVAAGEVSGSAKDYYKPTPDASGKAFRIAFAPLSITGTGTQTSIAYAKVWAKNDGGEDSAGKFVSTSAVNDNLTASAYSTATTQLSGYTGSTAYGNATAGSGKVLMKGSEAIPQDNYETAANALTNSANFLGVFKKDPGQTVTLTYRCVAWFEGTYDAVISSGTTNFETIVAGMTFGVSNLKAA